MTEVTEVHLLQATLCGLAALAAAPPVRPDSCEPAKRAAAAEAKQQHGAIAWYCVAVLALNAARIWLAELLPEGKAVRVGWDLWLRSIDQAAWIGLKLAPAALAMVLFLRRKPWLIVGAWALSWIAVVVSYPELRGPPLMHTYTMIELAGSAGVGSGCFLIWRRGHRFERERHSVAIHSGIVLIGASLATVLIPTRGMQILERWDAFVFFYALVFAIVGALLVARRIKEGAHA